MNYILKTGLKTDAITFFALENDGFIAYFCFRWLGDELRVGF